MKNSWFNFTPLNILRLSACIGTFLTFICKILFVSDIRPNQYYSFYALILISVMSGVSLLILRNILVTVLKNCDLLVPLGLYITTDSILGFFWQSSTYIFFKNGRLNWTDLTATIFSLFLLQILINVFFTGWMTRVILRFTQTEKVNLIESFKNIGWWFPRTLGVLMFGWTPLFLILFIMSPLLFSSGKMETMWGFIYVFVLFTGVFSLIWNLATFAVLPYVLWITTSLKQAIREGMFTSWKNKSKVFLPIILLMVVCGWITFISVTYRVPKIEEKFGESPSYATNLKSKFNYATNFVWIGGYRESSDWHKNMMKAVEEEPLSSVDFRIKIVILFLSLVVSLKIIKTIFGNNNSDSDIEKILSFDKVTLSNNLIIVPVLAVFAVLFPFELFNPARGANSPDPDAAKFVVPKVYTDENFFTKSEFFKTGQHDTYEQNAVNNQSFQLGSIADISILGNESDVVISGNRGSLIFDKAGNLKEKIKYNLSELSENKIVTVDADTKNVTAKTYSRNAKVVDLENDGIYEFAGVATDGTNSKGFILNNKGEIIRKFKDGNERFSIRNVDVKDVDGDGEKEIIVEYSGTLKFFDLKGEEKWSQDSSADTLSNNSTFIDIDGDKKSEILHDSYAKGTIRKLKSDTAEKIKRPFEQHGFLTENVEKPMIIFLAQNKLGLFDFEGNLIVQYPAPLSFIEKDNSLKKADAVRSLNRVDPYRASALKVKLKSDAPEYLAVLATLSTETENGFVDMLYIYDESGKIVCQESTNGGDHLMKIMPLENGTQGLLIQEKETVWLYKAN